LIGGRELGKGKCSGRTVGDEIGEELMTRLGDDQSVVDAGGVGGRSEEGDREEGIERLREG
jgi:hypothetical protein